MRNNKIISFVLPFTFIILGCSTQQLFSIKEVENDFIYKDKIQEFNKDSISNFLKLMEQDMNKPKAILNELHLSIFQNPKDVDSIITEQTYFLYNIQSLTTKRTRITVIGTNDNWINEITLLSFNKFGRLCNKSILAELGGDQDYFIESQSKLQNDSTYIKTIKNFKYDINTNSNKLINQFQDTVNIKQGNK
ncbi:hypothetical protein [Brumimicrobium mesophilum]|uniref:hypothetical protein n=1 Tax=Brumimicrobium mesophilum TaxID=392717 RepID=UPI000D144A5A|nr:hypothetical protein [Brumimicrobium mesophilum]